MSTVNPTPAPATPKRKSPLRDVVLIVGPLLVLAGGVLAYFHFTSKPTIPDPSGQLRPVGVNITELDKDFKDADDDLVADPPANTIDPKVLVFTTLERGTEEAVPAGWKAFIDDLSKRLKRKVEWRREVAFEPDEALEQFKKGEIHVAALSTGTVPTMVNAAGFVPVCCMANDKGEYVYHVEIISRADRGINGLEGLRGKSIAMTSMRSLSSFKAPVQTLWDKGLVFGKDYDSRLVASQERGILEVVEGKYDAAAVASDLLKRVLEEKEIDPKKLHTVYRSEKGYPPACFGYHHALKKELADEIKKAFLEYEWDEAMKKEFGPAGYTKFVAVSYKKDWEPVRKIDQELNRLLDRK
jgi:phosphonate transport system substrate-binding protein